MGAPPLIKADNILSPVALAEAEFEKNAIPLHVVREKKHA